MKQARCNKDLFWAPTDGEIICKGAGSSTDIKDNTICKVICQAAHAVPNEITCLADGWDVDVSRSRCDATAGSVSPGGQIALIVLGLALLCVGTFLYQRYRRNQKDQKVTPEKNPVQSMHAEFVSHETFDRNCVRGMGKDGLDNLQTVKLNEMSPLPLPRTENVTNDKTSTMSKRDPSARYSDVKVVS